MSERQIQHCGLDATRRAASLSRRNGVVAATKPSEIEEPVVERRVSQECGVGGMCIRVVPCRT
jgi:hypothetical protein